ncbi:MAG: bifunctional 4-hydroxy-2-oxoglutarate aldolase/2-dehydro-3-deoxy-phosphogluconate aldolase [Synechococcus sp.]
MPITSDPAGLRQSLVSSPLLAVLRPGSSGQAERQIQALADVGVHHVELSWSDDPAWPPLVRHAINHWPGIRFGAAGLRYADQLQSVADLGLTYAMSPIGSTAMVAAAAPLGLTLVPGVFSPTEVNRFREVGLVKLFPAASLPPLYWRQLRQPLHPLPFCIAAGGLRPEDAASWFAAGVQAVALGSSLFDADDQLRPHDVSVLRSLAKADGDAD